MTFKGGTLSSSTGTFLNGRNSDKKVGVLKSTIKAAQRVEDISERRDVIAFANLALKTEKKRLKEAISSSDLMPRSQAKLLKRYNLLPMSSYGAQHIHFDSFAFHLLLSWIGINDDTSATGSQCWPWLDHLDLSSLNLGMPGEYSKLTFASHISTDGVSCNIMLFRPRSEVKSTGYPKEVSHQGHIPELKDYRNRPLYAIDMGFKDFIVCVPHKDNPRQTMYDEGKHKRRRNKRIRYRTRKRKKHRNRDGQERAASKLTADDKSKIRKRRRQEAKRKREDHADKLIEEIREELKNSSDFTRETKEKWRRNYKQERQKRKELFENPEFSHLKETVVCSNRRYQFEIKRPEHLRKIRKWKKTRVGELTIEEIERKLLSSKVPSEEEYKLFMRQESQFLDTLLMFYGHKRFSRMAFDGYIARKSAMDRLCMRITRGNSQAIVAIGADGNTRHPVAPSSPVPTKRFINTLSRFCTVVMVDEFRTSKMLRGCTRAQGTKERQQIKSVALLQGWEEASLQQRHQCSSEHHGYSGQQAQRHTPTTSTMQKQWTENSEWGADEKDVHQDNI